MSRVFLVGWFGFVEAGWSCLGASDLSIHLIIDWSRCGHLLYVQWYGQADIHT